MRVIFSLNVYLLWKKTIYIYNLGLFKMKKSIFTLPQDSNSSETFLKTNLRVKKEYMSTWFLTIFAVGCSFILLAGMV